MKVLLVAPRDWVFPIGLCYISAALKEAGHEVAACYHDDADLPQLLARGYDFVGLGGMCMHYHQLQHVVAAAKQAHTPIIAGGNMITAEPELMSRALGVDYAVIGQGEETVVELLACLEQGGDLSTVDGIAWFDESGQFIATKQRQPARDLDTLPWPDVDAFRLSERLDRSKPSDDPFWDVFDHPREYIVIGGRSCPYQCTFCYHPAGEKYRQRSVASIMDELREMVPRYRANIISIVDDLFASKPARLYEFCEQFKAFRDTLDWDVVWMCQLRVDCASPELLATMRDAGCYLLSYGFESYSAPVLKSMQKKLAPEQIHRALHWTQEQRISIQANFIFGDPAETLDTARETLDFWREHGDAITLEFIRVYPDSAIYRYALETGRIPDRLEYLTKHLGDLINLTQMPDADFGRLQAMVAQAKAELPRSRPLERTADSLTMQCPHCQAIVQYKNFTAGVWLVSHVHCRECRRRIVLDNEHLSWVNRPQVVKVRRALARLGIKPSRVLLGLKTAVEWGEQHTMTRPLARVARRLLSRFLVA